MDDRTDELRDLFLDVAGTDSVTEDQERDRWGNAALDEGDVDDRLRTVIERMAAEFGFEPALSTDERVTLIRGFYRGDSDATLAQELGVDEQTVRGARLDLHLFRETDTDAPVDWDRLRNRLDDGDDETVAAELDLEPAEVAHYRRVALARDEARRVSHRYRTAFRDVIPDADLAERLTASISEDGLEEAAADIETDVSF